MSLSFAEKVNNFTGLLNGAAAAQGCAFIQDCGEGHDLETDTLYLEDVSGWLVPTGTKPEDAKKDENYCFAEWKEIAPGQFSIDFVVH